MLVMFRLGQGRLCQGWLGQVRVGYVRDGLARLGQVILWVARLGQGWLCKGCLGYLRVGQVRRRSSCALSLDPPNRGGRQPVRTSTTVYSNLVKYKRFQKKHFPQIPSPQLRMLTTVFYKYTEWDNKVCLYSISGLTPFTNQPGSLWGKGREQPVSLSPQRALQYE